jgi:hypothetical protein
MGDPGVAEGYCQDLRFATDVSERIQLVKVQVTKCVKVGVML